MIVLDRNVNLEEIGTDAPFGVEQLMYQTIVQKVVMTVCVIASAAFMIVNTFLIHLDSLIAIAIMILPLIFAVMFSCNYNQDMSLGAYFIHMFTKPFKRYNFQSYSGIESLEEAVKDAGKVENVTEKDEEFKQAQKKQLIRLAVVGMIVVIAVIAALVVAPMFKESDTGYHHEAAVTIERWTV